MLDVCSPKGGLSYQMPIRVAVIGGGCASIAAAFELSRPQHQGKYQVTVYQVGWRLGGKGASGRGPAARIEEHGFHVWFGFYENAFRLMRECYAELGRDPRKCQIADWRDAFVPAPFIGVADGSPDGSYSKLLSYVPPADGLPGDPITDYQPFSVATYLARAAVLLRTLLLTAESHRGADHEPKDRPGASFEGGGAVGAGAASQAQDLTAQITRLMKYGMVASTAGLIQGLGLLQTAFTRSSPYAGETVVRLIEAMALSARRQLEAALGDDGELLMLWQTVDLVITSMLGIVRFGLLTDPRGFDAINEYDFRDWMRINGASEGTLKSSLVRGLYDLVFAYENGDYDRPRHAAGVALRGTLRSLFVRGSVAWKMQAGMGDIVFAPFYEVLKRRGVSFQFFHRLRNVKLAEATALAPGERPHVTALEFDIQAEITGGQEYRPLIDVGGLPCWPSEPDFSQLAGGKRLERENRQFESHWDRRKAGTRSLRVVDDFDFVVLGIGLGAIPEVCRDFIERDQRWRDMVAHVKTIETQAFQVWMRDDMEALGWPHPPISLSAFARPFETWGDMRHLIEQERWAVAPGAISYFCSALTSSEVPAAYSESSYPRRRNEQVRRNAIDFLDNHIGQLWPNAVHHGGGFRWELLMDPREKRARKNAAASESRFDSQFWTANVNPSDRYVISVPGSPKYRISPLDNTYDNLTIAGDWTSCGLDSGCVESAVISGRLAAHAISFAPALEEIVGYDHP
jgi:uncharacterized protein with NAD-binding domain and iron-sulfur cluster